MWCAAQNIWLESLETPGFVQEAGTVKYGRKRESGEGRWGKGADSGCHGRARRHCQPLLSCPPGLVLPRAAQGSPEVTKCMCGLGMGDPDGSMMPRALREGPRHRGGSQAFLEGCAKGNGYEGHGPSLGIPSGKEPCNHHGAWAEGDKTDPSAVPHPLHHCTTGASWLPNECLG